MAYQGEGVRLTFRPLHDEGLDPAASNLLRTDEMRTKARVVLRELYATETARLRVGEMPD